MEQTDIKQQVAGLIRQTRKTKGLTQQEMADKLGVSKGTYNRYEDETANLSAETIGRIANALGVIPKLTFE